MAAPSKTARIALVGAGWWSQGWHLPHLGRNAKCELAAIVDPTAHPKSNLNPDMESLMRLSERYDCATFSSLEEMLAPGSGAGDIDGVVVSTNHASHHELATAAMRAGINVFCEKPMTVDIDEAKELYSTARDANVTFMVNNTANWRPQAVQARSIVESGALGELRHGSIVFHASTQAVFNDPTLTGWNEPSGNMVGNGFAWGQAAHPLAWFWMVSQLTPAEVFSFHGKATKTNADMFDACSILCTNGATVSFSGSGSYPGNDKQIENRFIGDLGALTYCGRDEDKGQSSLEGREGQGAGAPAGWEGLELRRYDTSAVESWEGFAFENCDIEGDGPESLNAFIDACRGDESYFAGADAAVGLKAVATIDAMYRSARSGAVECTFLDDFDLS